MLKTNQQREDYALRRMSAALERVLGHSPKEVKAQSVRWIAAWKACHARYLQACNRRACVVRLEQVWQDTCPEV